MDNTEHFLAATTGQDNNEKQKQASGRTMEHEDEDKYSDILDILDTEDEVDNVHSHSATMNHEDEEGEEKEEDVEHEDALCVQDVGREGIDTPGMESDDGCTRQEEPERTSIGQWCAVLSEEEGG